MQSVAMYFPIEGCSHHFKITNPSSLLASIGALSLISLNMSSLQTEATNTIQLLSNPNPEHEMWDFLTDRLLLEFHQPYLFEDVSKKNLFCLQVQQGLPAAQDALRAELAGKAGISPLRCLIVDDCNDADNDDNLDEDQNADRADFASPSSAVTHHLLVILLGSDSGDDDVNRVDDKDGDGDYDRDDDNDDDHDDSDDDDGDGDGGDAAADDDDDPPVHPHEK